MAIVLGGFYFGLDDNGKRRPHIAIGVYENFGGNGLAVLAPLTDYHKCTDKSFSFCDEDHHLITKDCVIFFEKCRAYHKGILESKFDFKPPPFDENVVKDIVKIAISDNSRVPSVYIKTLKMCHGIK